MPALWNEDASMSAQEAETIEIELKRLIRKLKRVDLYYGDRVERALRAVRHQEVVEEICSRVCLM